MNPRRYSQIERALSILDKSGTVEILRDDQYLLFLFKKTERVVSALYVVTGLFPEAEPLKWGIRESGTLLLKNTLASRYSATTNSREFLSDIFAEMAHLHSLLDIAHVADLLSGMNFLLLKKELESVLGIIEGKWRTSNVPVSSPLLEESFFGIPTDIFSSAQEGKNEATPLSSSVTQKFEENSALHAFGAFERFKRGQKDIHKGQAETTDNVLNRSSGAAVSKTRMTSVRMSGARLLPNQAKEGRRRSILDVLRQQKDATIKDFSSVVNGCSEKTIQRLLIAMVRDGVLKREGDRRWSRYSIII